VRSPAVAQVLGEARATHIDLLNGHLTELEAALGTTASEQLGSFHTVGDTEQYFARMRAVEYAIEHDDGQSMRALDQADVLIVAPSVRQDADDHVPRAAVRTAGGELPPHRRRLPTDGLPRAIAPYAACFGLTTTPLRLSQVRHERRPDSTYASLAQCTLELRRAEDLYRRTHIPFVNSSTKSVEEMSAVIMQSLKLRT
jgi:regulator of PEP synthase PpsR (kinase-PPPase family)